LSTTIEGNKRTERRLTVADVLPSDIANAIMGKLYDVLTNGDETVPKSADNFSAGVLQEYLWRLQISGS
jgi:hypothetical protein